METLLPRPPYEHQLIEIDLKDGIVSRISISPPWQKYFLDVSRYISGINSEMLLALRQMPDRQWYRLQGEVSEIQTLMTVYEHKQQAGETESSALKKRVDDLETELLAESFRSRKILLDATVSDETASRSIGTTYRNSHTTILRVDVTAEFT